MSDFRYAGGMKRETFKFPAVCNRCGQNWLLKDCIPRYPWDGPCCKGPQVDKKFVDALMSRVS